MIIKDVNVENPELHWEYIKCKDQVALDLGCGRWEKTEKRESSWLTTPEFLISRGAKHVYAFDCDPEEIAWFNKKITKEMNITAIHKCINSADDIKDLYSTYKPTVIKCDIEFNEKFFSEITDEMFSTVKFYAVETHTDNLYNTFLDRFKRLGYNVIASINLVHAYPMKAIFAEKA